MSTSESIETRLIILADRIEGSLERDSEETWSDLECTAGCVLDFALSDGSDDEANRAWYLKIVAGTRLEYLRSFRLMQSDKYYEAWCKLEQAEIALISLRRNQFYAPARFSVETLARTIANWQALFPYAVFLAPSSP